MCDNPIDNIPGHFNVEKLLEAYHAAKPLFEKAGDGGYIGVPARAWLKEYGPPE